MLLWTTQVGEEHFPIFAELKEMGYEDSFGKLFRISFDGSMNGAGPDVFVVWMYVIARTTNSRVHLNPVSVATTVGKMTPDRVTEAIAYLCAPDPWSKNKAHEGRRLLSEGEDVYWVVSHTIYRNAKNEDDLRNYNKLKQREHRAKLKRSKLKSAEALAAKVAAADEADKEIPY
jgi:hypothetical protein